MQANCDLPQREDRPDSEYTGFVGSVLYLALWTRPDILNTVRHLTRAFAGPTEAHKAVAKQLARYLHGTQNNQITYKAGDPMTLEVYSDSDYAGKQNNGRRSTSGMVVMAGGTYISARSHTQTIVAQSTAEAEYIALAEAIKETLWLRQLYEELELDDGGPVKVRVDNTTAIQIAEAVCQFEKTKHIAVRYHLARHAVTHNQIQLVYVNTKDNLADKHTKALDKTTLLRLASIQSGWQLKRTSD